MVVRWACPLLPEVLVRIQFDPTTKPLIIEYLDQGLTEELSKFPKIEDTNQEIDFEDIFIYIHGYGYLGLRSGKSSLLEKEGPWTYSDSELSVATLFPRTSRVEIAKFLGHLNGFSNNF